MQTSENNTSSNPNVASNTPQTDEATATAPGQIRVIKRNGKVVAYTEDKISIAITKAFLAVEGGTAVNEP